jgi:hypothetical protein
LGERGYGGVIMKAGLEKLQPSRCGKSNSKILDREVSATMDVFQSKRNEVF